MHSQYTMSKHCLQLILNTETIALVNHLGFAESGGKCTHCLCISVTRSVRPSHSCVVRGVSSGQPLWVGIVQVADALLALETKQRLAI